MTDFAELVLKADSTGLVRGKSDLDRLTASAGKAEAQAGKMSAAFSTAAARLGAMAAAAVSVTALANLATEYTTLNNRLRTVTASQEEANATLAKVSQIAAQTRAPLGAMVSVYQRASMAAADLGASQQETLDFTRAVGLALAQQGGSAEAASGALMQLSQTLGAGTVRAEEFNSILEGAFPIAQAAAKGIDEAGGSVSRLRQLVVEGKISSQEFFDALVSQAPALQAAFANTAPTIASAFGVLRDQAVMTIGSFDQMIGASSMVASAILVVANNLDRLAVYAGVAATAFVASMAPGLVMAAVAAGSLSGALVVLRGALIRTGIGALVVGAGELVYQFTRLARKAGGFGEALALLKDVAAEVMDRISASVGIIPPAFDAAMKGAASYVMWGLHDILAMFESAMNNIVDGLNGIFNLGIPSADFSAALTDLNRAGNDAAVLAQKAGGAAAEAWGKATAPLQSVAALTAAIAKGEDAAGTAGAAAGGAIADAMGGSGGAAGAMTDAAKAAAALAEEMNNRLTTAVDGVAGAWGDFVAGGLSDFRDFRDNIIGTFRQMLSDMIATAAKNKIILSMGIAGGFTPDQVAQAQLSSGGNTGFLGSLLGGGNATGTGILGNLTSGIGGFFKNFGAGLSSVWTGLTTGGLSGAFASISSALSGIGGAATGFAGLGAAVGALAGPVGIVVGLLSAFKTKTKLLDQGLKVTVTGMDTLVETYKRVEKSKLFGLIKSTKTSGGVASADVADPITAAVADMQSKIMDAADVLGVASAAFDGFSYQVKISTKGMSKDEALQALQDKIAEVGDAFAGMVPGLADLRKQGEGATDALTRLSNSLSAVNSMTDTLGLTFEAVGLTGADMASQLADAFGGLDAMASAQATYFQSFYTESERVATMTRQATEALAELGGAMPRTRDEYRAMVAAQDLTTEAGRELFAALVSMAGVMDQVLPAVASFTRELEALAATATGQLDDMISQTTEAQRAALAAASAWYDTAETLRDFVSDMRSSASELVSATAARAYNEARYQQLLAATLAGDRAAAGDLTGAASALIESTNATARSSAEAAIAQARVMSDLGLAAGVSDIYGAQQDVVASLLGEQVDILTEVRDYLAAGGTLDPAHIDALNGQLGSLQSAIEAAQAVDYASIMASLDATVTVIDGVTDPALRTLLENATDGLTATVDFIARLDGLTPEERWLALNSETEHLRTVALLARDEIPINLATLALSAASETERAVRIVLGADTLTEAQRAIALATSSELQRTISLTLSSDSSPEAQALALATGGDIARFVSLVVSPDMTQEARDLALTTGGLITRVVQLSIAAGVSAEAQSIALTAGGDIIRDVLVSLANGTDQNALAVALSSSDTILRSVVASVDLSALTDEQRAFVTALSGAQTGSLVLGGSSIWNPSEGFEAWFDRVTAENVANPLVALASPMAELRASLDLLTATLREVQSSTPTAPTAPTTPTDTGGGSNTAAALASLQSQGAAVLATRDAAQSAVATYNRLYGAWETEVFGRSSGGPAQATLNSANRQLEDLRAQVIDLGGIPAFLRGGDHAGGWRMVGEAGPELEATGPSRIFNARETKRIMSGAPAKPDDAALIAELRALRKEVAELRDQNRQLDTRVLNEARKTRFIAEKWDADGMPAVRA